EIGAELHALDDADVEALVLDARLADLDAFGGAEGDGDERAFLGERVEDERGAAVRADDGLVGVAHRVPALSHTSRGSNACAANIVSTTAAPKNVAPM